MSVTTQTLNSYSIQANPDGTVGSMGCQTITQTQYFDASGNLIGCSNTNTMQTLSQMQAIVAALTSGN